MVIKTKNSNSTIKMDTAASDKVNPFQDFSLNLLPGILDSNDYQSFNLALDSILSNHSNLLVIDYDTQLLNLLILDLVFIKQAAGHKGWKLPNELNLLIDHTCRETKRLPILLYEDCILVNPSQPFTRVFSTGKIRNSEKLFIHTHQQIEQELARLIHYVESFHVLALKSFDCAKTQSIAFSYGQKSIDILKEIKFQLASLKNMPPEHFAAFRNYYKSLPQSDSFGPSGRFSAKLFIARILINGHAIIDVVPNFFKEILENIDYFPSQDRSKLLEIIAETQTNNFSDSFTTNMEVILQKVASEKTYSTFIKLAKSMGTLLDQLLGIHLGLVHRYVVPLESQSQENNTILSQS